MNVFVLCTGRCGSKTFTKACRYMTNYTASHESQKRLRYSEGKHPYSPLRYPENHIEVDNRLSWFLGTLEKEYGDDAFYVHFLRKREEVARSFMKRGVDSILFSFAWGVLQYYQKTHGLSEDKGYQIGLQYYDTVNDNIKFFLRNKPHQMTMWLHEIKDPFRNFWERIGAQGDLGAALAEWDVRHNASKAHKVFRWKPVKSLEPMASEDDDLIES
jgi:hypothetical protein